MFPFEGKGPRTDKTSKFMLAADKLRQLYGATVRNRAANHSSERSKKKQKANRGALHAFAHEAASPVPAHRGAHSRGCRVK